MERAKQVVVLCDARKFGHLSMVQVAPLSAVHVLVANETPPASLNNALNAAGAILVKV